MGWVAGGGGCFVASGAGLVIRSRGLGLGTGTRDWDPEALGKLEASEACSGRVRCSLLSIKAAVAGGRVQRSRGRLAGFFSSQLQIIINR